MWFVVRRMAKLPCWMDLLSGHEVRTTTVAAGQLYRRACRVSSDPRGSSQTTSAAMFRTCSTWRPPKTGRLSRIDSLSFELLVRPTWVNGRVISEMVSAAKGGLTEAPTQDSGRRMLPLDRESSRTRRVAPMWATLLLAKLVAGERTEVLSLLIATLANGCQISHMATVSHVCQMEPSIRGSLHWESDTDMASLDPVTVKTSTWGSGSRTNSMALALTLRLEEMRSKLIGNRESFLGLPSSPGATVSST
mmetsp:Transcript_22200/g.40855  ORF Transcript_22200/g.40855 Transcript_22200/m.40855 type:complete len:249 (-) Transcript_22200:164-910(-)